MNFKKSLKRFGNKVFFLLFTKRFKNRLSYYFRSNNSNTLIIVFSAFASKPSYNYVKTLKDLNFDQLFILDDFGYKGSYYWYENGDDYPRTLTESLISKFINRGGYKRLITAGSSKGGTCAIYFGLKYHATHIFAGACQYLVGNYLYTECNREKFYGMMGRDNEEENRAILNNMVSNEIKKEKGNNDLHFHLLYSNKEHTYEDDIIPLIEDLKKYKMTYDEEICDFDDHSDVGKFFGPYLIHSLQAIINND